MTGCPRRFNIRNCQQAHKPPATPENLTVLARSAANLGRALVNHFGIVRHDVDILVHGIRVKIAVIQRLDDQRRASIGSFTPRIDWPWR
jgi:hypothetical protein